MSTWNTLITVARKELLDLFRDRRTVMISLLIMPLLFPALILGVGYLTEKRVKTQLEETLQLPVVGAERAPNLIAFLKTQNIEVKQPPKDVDAAIVSQSEDIILRISADYPTQWRKSEAAPVEIIFDSSRQDAQMLRGRVEAVLENYSRRVGALRVLSRGGDPMGLRGIEVQRRDMATPEAKRGQILAVMLPYFLILSAFLGGAYLVMDTTAGERERQSLEPLLATPARRGAIMSGKILAATLLGILSLALIMLSLKLSFSFATGAMKSVQVDSWMLLKLLFVLLPMILIGNTLLTLISASVKSLKEAQSYMSLLMLLPIIPTLVLMANPLKNQLWQFAVPFLAQNQMILKLIRSEVITAMEWLVYLGAGLGLSALLWFLAARLYHKEKLAISA